MPSKPMNASSVGRNRPCEARATKRETDRAPTPEDFARPEGELAPGPDRVAAQRRIRELVRHAGDLRHDSIECFKIKIELEEYVIDPDAVARKMLAEAVLEAALPDAAKRA